MPWVLVILVTGFAILGLPDSALSQVGEGSRPSSHEDHNAGSPHPLKASHLLEGSLDSGTDPTWLNTSTLISYQKPAGADSSKVDPNVENGAHAVPAAEAPFTPPMTVLPEFTSASPSGPYGFLYPHYNYFSNELESRSGGSLSGQLFVPMTDYLVATAGGSYTGVSEGTVWSGTFGLFKRADQDTGRFFAGTQMGVGVDLVSINSLFGAANQSSNLFSSQVRMEFNFPVPVGSDTWWILVESNWPAQSDQFLIVDQVLFEGPNFIQALAGPGNFELYRGVQLGLRVPVAESIFVTPFWRNQTDYDLNIAGTKFDWVVAENVSVTGQFAASGDNWICAVGVEFAFGSPSHNPDQTPWSLPRILRSVNSAQALAFGTHRGGPSKIVNIPK